MNHAQLDHQLIIIKPWVRRIKASQHREQMQQLEKNYPRPMLRKPPMLSSGTCSMKNPWNER
jgi:hypothetical protein